MTELMYLNPSGSSGKVVYHTQRIWDVGQKIVQDAAAAQQEHLDYVNTTINSYMPTALRTIDDGFRLTQNLLRKHIDRLGQPNATSIHKGCYDWQVQMGNTLKFISAGIEEMDNNWANAFKGKVPT